MTALRSRSRRVRTGDEAPAGGESPDTRDRMGMWATLKTLYRSEAPALTGTSAASFVGGATEAALLVLIANLALSLGGDEFADQQSGLFNLSGFDTMTLFWIAIGLTVVRLGFQYVASRLAARTVSRVTQKVRTTTFDAYVHASWELQSSESEASVHDLLLRHVAKAQSAVATSTQMLSSGFMVLALVVSSFLVDPISAGFIIAVGLLLFALLRPLTVRAKRLSSRQVKQGLAYGVQSREAVDLSLEIRAYGVSDQVSERLEAATEREIAPLYRAQLMSRMLTAVYTSGAVLILLLALLGIDTFLERPLASIGAIVVVLIRALNQTSGVQAAYHSMGEFLPYLERLNAETVRFRASVPPSGSVELSQIGPIRFDAVSYSYDGSHDALTDVSFEVSPGEAIGIIGPSGSGKSTLIQLLLRLRHASSGRYTVDGVDVTDIDDDTWFDLTAFVPQDSRVYDASIAENIAFFRTGTTREQVESAARRAHLHDEIVKMPDGYDTVLGSRGGSLSGGQRQRLCIARALVRRPSMLVLDEPTSALDMRSESLVHETLAELKGSVTLFVIAHRLSTLNTCDRIMVLEDGRLRAFAERAALERDDEFYRQALELSRIRS